MGQLRRPTADARASSRSWPTPGLTFSAPICERRLDTSSPRPYCPPPLDSVEPEFGPAAAVEPRSPRRRPREDRTHDPTLGTPGRAARPGRLHTRSAAGAGRGRIATGPTRTRSPSAPSATSPSSPTWTTCSVAGVGLVTGLEDTGGGVPPGPERSALEDYLRKRGVENIKELFNSKTTSLVRVAARIPAGAHKSDPWTSASRSRKPAGRPASAAGSSRSACSTTSTARGT